MTVHRHEFGADVREAHAVEVHVCEHGHMTITFYDDTGACFAGGIVGPESVLALTQLILTQLADMPDAVAPRVH